MARPSLPKPQKPVAVSRDDSIDIGQQFIPLTQEELVANGYGPAPSLGQNLDDEGLPALPEAPGAIRSAADVALRVASGATGAVKSGAQMFGTDNRVAEALGGVQKGIQGLGSEYDQTARRRQQAISERAEGQGIGAEAMAAVKGIADSPVRNIAEAAGSLALPMGVGLFGKLAQLGQLGQRTAMAIAGGIQGTGAAKGAIADITAAEGIKAGMHPDDAVALGHEAAEYGRANGADLLVSGLLGAAAGGSGFEGAAARIMARDASGPLAKAAMTKQPGLAMTAMRGAAVEAVPEGIHGGHERYAGNVGAAGEGFNVDPSRGVAGAATQDAIVSTPLGAGASIAERMSNRLPAAAAKEEGPLTRALLLSAPSAPSAPDQATIGTIEVGSEGRATTAAQRIDAEVVGATPDVIAAARRRAAGQDVVDVEPVTPAAPPPATAPPPGDGESPLPAPEDDLDPRQSRISRGAEAARAAGAREAAAKSIAPVTPSPVATDERPAAPPPGSAVEPPPAAPYPAVSEPPPAATPPAVPEPPPAVASPADPATSFPTVEAASAALSQQRRNASIPIRAKVVPNEDGTFGFLRQGEPGYAEAPDLAKRSFASPEDRRAAARAEAKAKKDAAKQAAAAPPTPAGPAIEPADAPTEAQVSPIMGDAALTPGTPIMWKGRPGKIAVNGEMRADPAKNARIDLDDGRSIVALKKDLQRVESTGESAVQPTVSEPVGRPGNQAADLPAPAGVDGDSAAQPAERSPSADAGGPAPADAAPRTRRGKRAKAVEPPSRTESGTTPDGFEFAGETRNGEFIEYESAGGLKIGDKVRTKGKKGVGTVRSLIHTTDGRTRALLNFDADNAKLDRRKVGGDGGVEAGRPYEQYQDLGKLSKADETAPEPAPPSPAEQPAAAPASRKTRAAKGEGRAKEAKPAKEARTPKTPVQLEQAARDRFAKRSQLDTDRDSMLTAMAKLGGLNTEQALQEFGAIEKPDLRRSSGVFGLPIFRRKGGKSVDDMRQALIQNGYLREDEFNDFEERLEQSLAGQDHYTPQGYMLRAEQIAEQRDQDEREAMIAEGLDPDALSEAEADLDALDDEAINSLLQDAGNDRENISDADLDALESDAQAQAEGDQESAQAPAEDEGGSAAPAGEEPGSGARLDEPAFQRAPSVASERQQAVQETVDRLTDGWTNAPNIEVLGSLSEAPARIRELYAAQNADGADQSEGVSGVFWRGTVYLMADHLGSDASVQRAIFHEALGHYGLRGLYGEALDVVLDTVAAGRPTDMRRKAEQYGLDLSDPDQRRTAAEEVLAELAETRPRLGIVQRALAAIRTFLRRFGVASELSNGELIRDYILPAQGWVERSAPQRDSAGRFKAQDPVAAQSSIGDLPMFMRGNGLQQATAINAADWIMGVWKDSRQNGRATFGKLGWLQTQYHKATKDADFKKVFDRAQEFSNDTAHYANTAADMAPNLLPKLDSLADTWKKAKQSKATIEKLSDALIAGTLSDPDPGKGKVFSQAELKARGFTDAEVALYREARAAVDDSLDALGRSTMVNLAQRFVSEREAQIAMSAPTVADAEKILLAALRKSQDPAASAIADNIRQKADRVTQLKEGGYFPLMRFGKYSVTIKDPKSKETLYFSVHESLRAANRHAREMGEQIQKTNPGAVVTHGTMNDQEGRLFSGVTPDTLEVFGLEAGVSDNPLWQEYVTLVKNNRSHLRRLIERKGTPGMSRELTQILAAFITSNARATSQNLHAGQLIEAASSIPDQKGEIKAEAIKLVEYLRNPQEEGAAIRGFMFHWFLGGSIASAAVNMSQSLTMTLPYLSIKEGAVKAGGRLMSAAAMVARGNAGLPADIAQAIARAKVDGVVNAQAIHALQGEASRNLGSNLNVRKALHAWGYLFQAAETFNRSVAFIAAYEQGKAIGVDPYAHAVAAVKETQGVYSKENRMNIARGTLGAVVFTFKQFAVMYVEFLSRLLKNKESRPAGLLALGVMMTLAGASGLPFMQDLDDIIDTVGQAAGYNLSTASARKEFLARVFGPGIAEFMERGVSAGLPVDVQARLGTGNLLPGTAAFKLSTRDPAAEAVEVFGVAGGLFKSATTAISGAVAGSPRQVGSAILPVAVKNAAQAVEMVQSGEYKDQRGRKVIDASVADAAAKFVGFNPSSVSADTRARREIVQTTTVVRKVRTELVGKMAQAAIDNDSAKMRELRLEEQRWNRRNPETPLPKITSGQIRERAKQIRQSAGDRVIKATPRELRGMAMERLQ